jgi:hypothetical protein
LRVSLSPSTRRTFLGRAAVIGGAVAAGGLPLARTAALGGPMPRGGSWLPGDLHTHSTYSHDVYGGPTDTNTGPDEAYTLGLPVAGKFAEGRERGLAFMAVSDHNDVRSVPELSSASGSLVALPAYEHSIHGHAQMLGATKLYDAGDQAADAINAMANELRAAGGVFQANHPAYKFALDGEFHACGSGAGGCADCRAIHWQYGFDVQPDTIEVWNPSVARSDVSEPSLAREATGVDDDRGRRRDADARRHAAAGDDLADLPAAPGAGTPRVAAQLLRQRLDQPRS